MASEGNIAEPSNRMLIAVGSFTLNWATMEMALDYWGLIVWHQYGGKDLEKENPKNLGRKIAFLETCLQRSPALATVALTGNGILQRVKALIDTRHDLIHGALHAVNEDESMILVRLIHDKQGHHDGAEVTMTLADILAGASAARRLAHEILGLSIDLDRQSRSRGQNDVNQAGGERSV